MIGILIVPTGIGAEIGGHAGDANPAVKLIAKCCDKLITHPNVVNASDINEMPENVLYVEGSMLDRFLEGLIGLKEVRTFNKILLVANEPVHSVTMNAASAARATIGANIIVVGLRSPLLMVGGISDKGIAYGDVSNWQQVLRQVEEYSFDALALHTWIEVTDDVRLNYYANGGINPWGKVESIASRLIADALDKPVAHAPFNPTESLYDSIVDPRLSAEMLSCSYLHSVLKGLHRAPRIGKGLSFQDVDFMVSPWGCMGRPHEACLDNGIPVIMVRENRTVLNDEIPDEFIVVENYWEAVGVIMAMKAGISHGSVRRPLKLTECLHA